MSYLNRVGSVFSFLLTRGVLCLTCLTCFTYLTWAAEPASSQITLKEGANGNYITLKNAQPTDRNKIEVLEFFGYFCPHCFAFEPELSAWVKKQSADVVFKRVPVRFNEKLEPQQKVFFALQIMGVVDSLQQKIFDEIHIRKTKLETDQELINYVVSQGVNKEEFLKLFNSFTVVNLARAVTKMQVDYQVDGVPAIVVAGKYQTSPSIAGGTTAALQVVNALIARERSQRPGVAISAPKKVQVLRPIVKAN